VSFQVERRGDRVLGLAQGIDRAHLDRLSRGETPVDLELDLHGLSAADARRLVRETLRCAHEDGDRCVLIIHGRGKHSELSPVLREGLVEWLQEPPTSRLVMAFASARPGDGGVGASYVLLRRRRS
jgi:DNA-nicking Smr family endonuclease